MKWTPFLLKLYQPEPFAFDALQIAFTVKLSAIVEHIVLPGHVEDVLGPAALENLIERVELFRLRQLGNIARVNQERRRSRHRVDAIECNLERLSDILVRFLAKADVTVTDLEKAKICSRQRGPRLSQFQPGSLTRVRRR